MTTKKITWTIKVPGLLEVTHVTEEKTTGVPGKGNARR